MAGSIYLIDRSRPLVDAWTHSFADMDEVIAIEGDFFQQPADAMISPANSFGIMDGGLDLAIRNTLGFEVQHRVQTAILEQWHGELPVGAAVVVPTDHPKWPWLIAAPTMRIPESVGRTLNAYLAFRAALLAIKQFNARSRSPEIQSLVCPGLGTGIGGMAAQRCALQMRMAYKQLNGPARVPSYDMIHKVHQALVRS